MASDRQVRVYGPGGADGSHKGEYFVFGGEGMKGTVGPMRGQRGLGGLGSSAGWWLSYWVDISIFVHCIYTMYVHMHVFSMADMLAFVAYITTYIQLNSMILSPV